MIKTWIEARNTDTQLHVVANIYAFLKSDQSIFGA